MSSRQFDHETFCTRRIELHAKLTDRMGNARKTIIMTSRNDDFTDAWFFDRWRGNRIASMTLVDSYEQECLYYYKSDYSCTVWVVAGADSLFIAYWLKGNGPAHRSM